MMGVELSFVILSLNASGAPHVLSSSSAEVRTLLQGGPTPDDERPSMVKVHVGLIDTVLTLESTFGRSLLMRTLAVSVPQPSSHFDPGKESITLRVVDGA